MVLHSDEGPLDAWMERLATVSPWDRLLAADAEERARLGYANTLREICQQPLLWPDSLARVVNRAEVLRGFIRREDETSVRPIVLTGSGSSQYVGECVAPILQTRFGVIARAVPASLLLTHPETCVSADAPLVVSFARSGDSPESAAVVDLLLDRIPDSRHLIITCNAAGRLATAYASDPRVLPVVLDPRTNDRSLVMTSSFTNMVVAGLSLGSVDGRDDIEVRVSRLTELARAILIEHAAALARVGAESFRRACFLAAGPQLGAAHEAALKMLEMSGGAVATMVETPLGLRHGPMAALRDDTLVVSALPSSPPARGYALDVLREIHHKRLAGSRVVVGSALPSDLTREPDVAVALRGYDDLDDGLAGVLEVVVGQILAFFRCMAERLHPDAPSPAGVISRVVPQFPLY